MPSVFLTKAIKYRIKLYDFKNIKYSFDMTIHRLGFHKETV